MTVSLEYVHENDWAAVSRLIDQLNGLLIDTGGRSVGIRFGSNTITWPGGSGTTSSTTVTHGLGRTPAGVYVSASTTLGGTHINATSVGATTFSVQGTTIDGSSPAGGTTGTFYWLVIG